MNKLSKSYRIIMVAAVIIVIFAAALAAMGGLKAEYPYVDSVQVTVKNASGFDEVAFEKAVDTAVSGDFFIEFGKNFSDDTPIAAITVTDALSFEKAKTITESLNSAGQSCELLSYNSIAAKNPTAPLIASIVIPAISLIVALAYIAVRYGVKSGLCAIIAPVFTVSAVVLTAALIGFGLSNLLVGAICASVILALFESTMVFGQLDENLNSRRFKTYSEAFPFTIEQVSRRQIRTVIAGVAIFIVMAVCGAVIPLNGMADFSVCMAVAVAASSAALRFIALPVRSVCADVKHKAKKPAKSKVKKIK